MLINMNLSHLYIFVGELYWRQVDTILQTIYLVMMDEEYQKPVH